MKHVFAKMAASSVAVLALGVGSASAASISSTGPHSYNSISSNYWSYSKKINNNDIGVFNTNYQFAKSGSALVWGNTFGGSATSGSASNYNTNSTYINLHN